MHSYIDIHHFAPIPSYKPLVDLTPLIDDALFEQDALTIVGKQNFASFRVDIIKSMEIYYQLVGIVKIIHYFDTLAREWELFPAYDAQSKLIEESIRKFRAHYVNISLELHFQMLLDRDKITNVGLVVKFYTTLIWHGIITPIVSLEQIIKYSAYDRIETSDLFYYELAAYRYLIMCCCGKTTHFCNSATDKESDPVRIQHLENYHKENMIQQLFRIRRNESRSEFEKARLNFEQLTGEKFQMDHFSDHLSIVQKS